MTAILDRLREPSSWAGIAALVGMLGVDLAPDVMEAGIKVAAAAAALAAVVLRERR